MIFHQLKIGKKNATSIRIYSLVIQFIQMIVSLVVVYQFIEFFNKNEMVQFDCAILYVLN